MTDRVQGLHIALDHDIREDDIAMVRDAVAQIRGVAEVTTIMVHADTFVARARYKTDLFKRLLDELEAWYKE